MSLHRRQFLLTPDRCETLADWSQTPLDDYVLYTHPDLELARTIVTNPFPGTTMKPSDAEGLAYVPSDNSIWLADDNGHRLFEIDATSGALKRTQ